MARCVLHIGVEKTGSTSIQSSLSKNRELLASRGVLFPLALGSRNHIKLYACSSETPIDELKFQCGLTAESDISEFRERVESELISEVASHQPELICISNEHCASRLTHKTEIQRLYHFLGRISSSLRVVVYIREQARALQSAYSTYIKTGGTGKFAFPSNDEIEKKYNYESLLARWSSVFGIDNIDVRIFDVDNLDAGDVVEDFVQYLGIERNGLILESRENVSLGTAGLEFLRGFNSWVPYLVAGKFNPLRGNIQHIVERLEFDTPFAGDPWVMTELSKAMIESNENVRRTYLPQIDGPLFSCGTPRDQMMQESGTNRIDMADNNDGLADEGMLTRIFAHAWQVKQGQLLQLRGRGSGLERRIAGKTVKGIRAEVTSEDA